VLRLHEVLGEGSIAPVDLGRLQQPGEERVAVRWNDGSCSTNHLPRGSCRTGCG